MKLIWDRSWKSDIERSRWQSMSSDYNKEQEILKSKQSRARIGRNSVSYNPINLEYHHNPNGAALAQEDAKAMVCLIEILIYTHNPRQYRTSVRSLNLYLKNNSFDPMRCQDIRGTSEPQPPAQREIATAAESGRSAQPSPGAESLSRPKFGRRSHHPIKTSSEATALSVPKLLIDTAISNAELVKKRLGDKGRDFAPTLSTNILDGDNQRWARHY